MASESSKPELRHEFIAMVFAVAVGEVGIELASLFKLRNFVHFLPGYAHLVLATFLIAASFVGWSKSPSPGAQRNVRKVLEWEFVLLLLDMALVIIYFLLVRSVDFEKAGEGNNAFKYVPDASADAGWLWKIFVIYVIWDFLAKFVIEERKEKVPLKNRVWRTVVTFFCLALSYIAAKYCVPGISPENVLVADASLIALVLLFRALKDLVSAYFPDPPEKPSVAGMSESEIILALADFHELKRHRTAEADKGKKPARRWTFWLFVIFVLGMVWCFFDLHFPNPLDKQMDPRNYATPLPVFAD